MLGATGFGCANILIYSIRSYKKLNILSRRILETILLGVIGISCNSKEASVSSSFRKKNWRNI
jgi:hypothetical protein